MLFIRCSVCESSARPHVSIYKFLNRFSPLCLVLAQFFALQPLNHFAQRVEAVIDHVTMQHTCQEILEKKEALRVAFGLRYQESRQAPQRDIGVKRGLEILNAMLASWGHTQIQKDQKRKLVSHQGRRTDHTPYKIVVLGRPESEEHQKNRLCLENLDVRPR